jgi:archaetidylinositol phosphate synthase
MHPWRNRLQAWFEPLARRTTLSPNSITAIALALILGASACLALAAREPLLFLAAVPLVAVGGLLDAFDGIVARVQDRQTPFGDFLDHFFDRVADLSLISGWCIGTEVGREIALLSLLAVSLNGYLGTQIEATFGKRSYEEAGRGEFVLALIVLPLFAYTLTRIDAHQLSWGGLSAFEWATTVLTLFALIGVLQRFRLAVRLGS